MMDWCFADESTKANHNPVVALSDDRTTDILEFAVKASERDKRSAKVTMDPDVGQSPLQNPRDHKSVLACCLAAPRGFGNGFGIGERNG